MVCQRDTCPWLHNTHLALRFCSLKKKKTDKSPPNKKINTRPHKNFSNFQVIHFFVNFHYKILLLLYGAEVSRCFFFSGICYVYLMWKKIKSYLEKEHQHSFNPRSMTLHNNHSLKNIKHTKKPITNE